MPTRDWYCGLSSSTGKEKKETLWDLGKGRRRTGGGECREERSEDRDEGGNGYGGEGRDGNERGGR